MKRRRACAGGVRRFDPGQGPPTRRALHSRLAAASYARTRRGLLKLAAMRVLVADDCPDTRETLAQVLRAAGHEVCVAVDGDDAVSRAVAWIPHALFLDISMPGRTGYEVAERVHRLLPGAIPVAVTGWPQREHLREKDMIFDRYLVKPVRTADFLALLDPARV